MDSNASNGKYTDPVADAIADSIADAKSAHYNAVGWAGIDIDLHPALQDYAIAYLLANLNRYRDRPSRNRCLHGQCPSLI
jgi:hypothetical protein